MPLYRQRAISSSCVKMVRIYKNTAEGGGGGGGVLTIIFERGLRLGEKSNLLLVVLVVGDLDVV